MIWVCSDIHGRYDRYIQAINTIKDTDTLYILGDVIDRHEDGIKILLDMIQRPNIKFIIGNHEFMMYQVLVKNNYRWKQIWCSPNNGGYVTYNAFTKLDSETQIKILEYLKNAYVFYRLTVNNKKYCLVHGSYECSFDDYDNPTVAEVYNKYADIISACVWDSATNYFNDVDYKPDTIYIVGHKFVQHFHDSYKMIKSKEKVYVIDGGCAFPTSYDNQSRLILYRLEDGKEVYIK
jgi:serine/threonine protein phosphatase 1